MSEALFIVNPRRKRRKSRSRKGRMPAGLRRYWASHRRGRKTAKRRRRRSTAIVRRRRRRNPLAALANPRRRRHRNPRRHRSYRRHRARMSNPFSVRGLKSVLMPAAIGATGAIALDVAYAYASPYLPATMQTGWFATLAKVAGAFGIGWGASKVLGREKGRVVTLGALTVVGYGAIKPIIASFAPTIKGLSGYGFGDYTSMPVGSLGAYLPRSGMGFISPAATLPPSGVGAYMSNRAPVAGVGGFADPAGYNWQNDGM